jgi:hypothetical protein
MEKEGRETAFSVYSGTIHNLNLCTDKGRRKLECWLKARREFRTGLAVAMLSFSPLMFRVQYYLKEWRWSCHRRFYGHRRTEIGRLLPGNNKSAEIEHSSHITYSAAYQRNSNPSRYVRRKVTKTLTPTAVLYVFYTIVQPIFISEKHLVDSYQLSVPSPPPESLMKNSSPGWFGSIGIFLRSLSKITGRDDCFV